MKYNSKPSLGKMAAVVAAIASAGSVTAVEFDLSQNGGPHNVQGDVGGTAIFANHWTQPAGTGVFEPFLTLDGNGQTSTGVKNIEQAYNTDGFSGLYLDQLRPQWNERLTIGDLAKLDVGGTAYYGFLLDANEPGGNKSLISIDNIRIYTSSTDNTASVGNNVDNLNNLGTLRWAMNDGLKNADGSFNIDTWVKLDSAQDNISHPGSKSPNGGSGMSDMIVYVPVSAFGDAMDSDYLWFYNLNGVHYTADKDLASQSGYEEWRAITGPRSVPDGGATLALLGLGLAGLAAIRRKS